MYYTDINKTYQIILTANGSEFLENSDRKFTTKIETPFSTWVAISRGEINGMKALVTGKYKVLGDITLMMKWSKLFG
jgi:putative sterol carrier protein